MTTATSSSLSTAPNQSEVLLFSLHVLVFLNYEKFPGFYFPFLLIYGLHTNLLKMQEDYL